MVPGSLEMMFNFRFCSESNEAGLKKKFEEVLENLKNYKPDIPSYNSNDLSLSDELNSLWLDDGVLTLITSYIGNSVYARNYPIYKSLYPSLKDQFAKIAEVTEKNI